MTPPVLKAAMAVPATASPHLARLGGRARPAGSAAADEARAYCGEVLAAAGYQISEHSFEYSKFTGAWATPAVGLFVPAIATALYLTRAASPAWFGAAGLTLIAAAGVIAYVGGAGVLNFPFMRRRGVNLEAMRPGGDEPAVWLVAHIDSKWQPVSMIVRVAGVVVTALALIALAGAALLAPAAGPLMLGVLWVGALPLMLSVVGARNHGTLDNASGVAAVLEAAESLPAGARVGVLITDAEELALAGARAWVSTASPRKPGVALNCDSVDDDGSLVVMYTKSAPREIISRLEQAASELGEPLRVLRLIPGILTDSVPLAEAGWKTVTLSRGTLRTLRRIHTSLDTLATMDGRGIAGAARVLAQTATYLTYPGEQG